MAQQFTLENDFWKFLVSIEGLKARKEIELFCSVLEINKEALKSYCDFLERFKISVETDERYIYPLKSEWKIKMEFKFSEWLALQMRMGVNIHEMAKPRDQSKFLRDKLKMAQKTFSLDGDEVLSPEVLLENLKSKIDYEILCKRAVKIEFQGHKGCAIFPYRLVFLDGLLCVIGENIVDRTLVYFGLENIAKVESLETSYEPHLSQIEVNEFIGHLRLVNGKEERLVLKIYDRDQVNLLPSYHYLGNPFVTSSAEGDMIWAATLEMCDDVFHWLYTMKNSMEILDPDSIRKEFSKYCELKKENSNAKKAS